MTHSTHVQRIFKVICRILCVYRRNQSALLKGASSSLKIVGKTEDGLVSRNGCESAALRRHGMPGRTESARNQHSVVVAGASDGFLVIADG
jgi:hypothetical protein